MNNIKFKKSLVASSIALAFTFGVQAQQNRSDCPDGQCPAREQQGRVVEDNKAIYWLDGVNQEKLLPSASWTLHALPLLPKQKQVTTAFEAREFALTSLPKVGFESGYHDITPAADKALSAIINQLKDKRNIRLSFVGHTDSQRLSIYAKKRYRDNQHLSEHRAGIVAGYFQQALGLSDDVIAIQGKGKTTPIASNDNPQGMAKNRRVELHAWYDEPVAVETVQYIDINKTPICQFDSTASAFAITLDGQPLTANDSPNNADQQRCVDVALEQADIQLNYDQHALSPQLATSHHAWLKDNQWTVDFAAYSNYRHFIARAEIRVFAAQQSSQTVPLVVLPLHFERSTSWQPPMDLTRNALHYVMRVYDKNGHFDETTLREITVATENTAAKTNSELLADVWTNNDLALQTIALSGGTVNVTGRSIPKNHHVSAFGLPVPITPSSQILMQQILPHGNHRVEVAVLDDDGNGQLYHRDMQFSDNDWFYVGLADFTLGKNKTNGPIAELTGDTHHFNNDVFVDGRLAFYTKGTWLKDYTVTASLDTKEEAASDILSNLSKKDPSSLLRRLEDENHFAIYGDDSTLIEDAPTQGRFYAKINDEKSHALWGNFITDIKDTEFSRLERGLYGFNTAWASEQITQFGERQTQVDLFAAEAGTQSVFEEHRATGGSLYYLQNQDITQGSERLTIEVRDKDSGLTISTQSLIAGQDYDVDSLQGRVLLSKPLASVSNDDLVVRTGGLSGHPVFLVVNYEYTPGFAAVEDMTYGGRIKHWLSDSWQLGLTGQSQESGDQDHQLEGIDLTYRHSGQSYIKLEAAQTKGLGTNSTNSLDGGFNFSNTTGTHAFDQQAQAMRVESGFALQDFNSDSQARGQFYWQRRDAGFSAPGQFVHFDTDQVGVQLDMPFTTDTLLRLRADARDETGGVEKQSAELTLSHQISQTWSLSGGLRSENSESANSELQNNIGSRTDLALQLDYQASTLWGAHVFGQGTLSHDESRLANNRLGLGANYQVSNGVRLSGEVSGGNQGFGGLIGTEYQYNQAGNIYLNYELDPDRTDNALQGKNGQLVSGVKHRFTDNTSVYGEQRYQHGDSRVGLTQAYGIEYQADDAWLLGLSYENGSIESPEAATLDRNAIALSASYKQGGFKYGGALEYREDKRGDDVRDSYLLRNNFNYKVNLDWRAQLRIDLAVSNANTDDQLNSDYTEALLGFAYRPVNNDAFNALFTYNYLADLAPSDQFNQGQSQHNYQQRSHVLAIDVNYDVSARWTLGGKYAKRTGELRQGRETGQWFDSTANLYVARADYHLVRHWDATIEARLLESVEAQDDRKGFLAAIHRHVGQHVKVGIGYNFTDFTDDLTDFDYDAKGWFINIVGKM